MANTVRFIHAADIHLGTAFKQAGSSDRTLGEALTRATYEAFDRVIAHALNEGADFVVLAGDTFNSAGMNLPAQGHLARGLAKLTDAGIRVLMVHGNHDPASGQTAAVPLPDGVYVFPHDDVASVEIEGRAGTCTVYGRSFYRSDERENLALGFARDSAAVNAVAILHANVGGSPLSDPYSPCTVTDLAAAKMDYWALGHIHLEGVVSSASPLAVYPGSTQALTINETGRHGCYLVELADGIPSTTWLSTGSVGVAHIRVDLTGCSSLASLPSLIAARVADELRSAETPHLVRIILEGRREFTTPLGDAVLVQIAEATQGELAQRSPRVWIDSTVVNRSRLNRMDDVESSANPFIRAMVELSNSIDVAELLATTERLGKTDNRTSTVISADRSILPLLASESDDLLREAREYAVSLLLGEGE